MTMMHTVTATMMAMRWERKIALGPEDETPNNNNLTNNSEE